MARRPSHQHEEHLKTGVAKQHIGRLMAGGTEFVESMRDVECLQQALANPALAFPFTGIGEEGVGLFGLVRQQAQVIRVIHAAQLSLRGWVVGTPRRGLFQAF